MDRSSLATRRSSVDVPGSVSAPGADPAAVIGRSRRAPGIPDGMAGRPYSGLNRGNSKSRIL
ncbi:Hypothetical protein CINCED_3A019696, partial [Cinara cedri]